MCDMNLINKNSSRTILAVCHFFKRHCFVVGKFDPGPHDDSLTNIQWLGLMSGENLVQKQREEALLANNKDIRIVASDHQIEKVFH